MRSYTIRRSARGNGRRRTVILALALTLAGTAGASAASRKDGAAFTTPDKAVAAFIAAARANDAASLLRILGPTAQEVIDSGDAVADHEMRERFVARYDSAHKIEREDDRKAVLVIGTEEWPFPIPLVRVGNRWRFDVAAGADEILNRRVGRNELNAIEVCRAYVQAQRDYAAGRVAAHQRPEYAQRFMSSPGTHDGLYWPAKEGEPESPVGPMMARARAEGYGTGKAADEGAPYHGYRYAILTRQGPAASGGAKDYVVNGHMVGGFALVAFPAAYGDSGVKTFIVDQDGIVYERDLGPETAKLAAAMTEFDPGPGWTMP
jgi:hypothetical protein